VIKKVTGKGKVPVLLNEHLAMKACWGLEV